MKHPHAELIKQWADDTSLVVQYNAAGCWIDVDGQPLWNPDVEYRFKPEKKPDYVMLVHILNNSLQISWGGDANCRLTFSGEDGKLIKAEVI